MKKEKIIKEQDVIKKSEKCEEIDEECEEELENNEKKPSFFRKVILNHIKKCFKIGTHIARSKINRNK